MKALTIRGAVFLLLCAGGTRVEAQGVASSFDQLGVLVKPGDKISVVDVTGREAKGRIGKVSREMLTLVTEAGPRQFGEIEVAKIRQRRDDSLKNGRPGRPGKIRAMAESKMTLEERQVGGVTVLVLTG